jgi:hypothetical protein
MWYERLDYINTKPLKKILSNNNINNSISEIKNIIS